jgi:hypothetical protein
LVPASCRPARYPTASQFIRTERFKVYRGALKFDCLKSDRLEFDCLGINYL